MIPGYDPLENMQLIAVGDVPVLNLRHAMELTEACEGPLGAKSEIQEKSGEPEGKMVDLFIKHEEALCQTDLLRSFNQNL